MPNICESLTNMFRCTFKCIVFRISTSMGTLFIVRHGETEWNREDRMQGFLESSLTDKGKAQATRRER